MPIRGRTWLWLIKRSYVKSIMSIDHDILNHFLSNREQGKQNIQHNFYMLCLGRIWVKYISNLIVQILSQTIKIVAHSASCLYKINKYLIQQSNFFYFVITLVRISIDFTIKYVRNWIYQTAPLIIEQIGSFLFFSSESNLCTLWYHCGGHYFIWAYRKWSIAC